MSNDQSDLGGAEGEALIIIKQNIFCLNQFATWMRLPDYTVSNTWKKVWLAGFLEKKHLGIIQTKNCLKQLPDGTLHWAKVVVNYLQTFQNWLQWANDDTAKWNRREWIEMVLLKYALHIWELTKQGRRGNEQLATDLGELTGTTAKGNLPELPDATFIVVILWVSNNKDNMMLPNKPKPHIQM